MRGVRNEEYLKYGQIIRIHDNGNDKEKRGLIGAKGFTDIDAKYLIFKKFKNIHFYRQGLFKILPRGVFEAHDELMNYEKNQSKGELVDQSETMQESITQLQSLRIRAEAQKVQYETVSKTRLGDYINFGEDVIFKHVDSDSYLSGSVRCSDGGLGAFKVELSLSLSSMLMFKLLPFRSYEKEGDKIKMQSPLRIKNLQNRCYLSREDAQDDSKPGAPKSERNSVLFNKFRGIRQNIVTTYSQSETWLIHLHESNQTLNDVQSIKTHDIITLKHTQKGGYLAMGPQKEPIIKELEDNEYDCFSCLWEIEFLPEAKISPPLAHEQQRRKESNCYCLRDLLSGETLKIGGCEQLKIYNAKGNDTNKLESLVKIGTVDLQLDVDQYFNETEPSKLVYMKALPYQTRRLKGKSTKETEHGFRISKIDDQTKRDVLFVLSTYEVLDEFASLLNHPVKDIETDVKSKKLQVVDNTLRQLIAYVKDCDIKNIESQILPKKKYQMILKDLNICTTIFKILHLMGEKIKGELFKNYKKEGEIAKAIFNNCYFLVFNMIKDNQTNKLYVSEKWLEIIMKNAIEIEEKSTHVALNEILTNNETVVTKFLNDSEINKILNIFRLKPPHEKFLNIFRSSCICGGTPIIGNQTKVLKRFFKTLSKDVMFRFVPIKIGNNQFQVKIKSCINKKDEKVRTIEELFNVSLNQDFEETWKYFLAYMNLLADMCYGRNYEAKRYVEESLTSQLNEQMKQAFNQAEKIETSDQSNQSLYILCTILQDEGIKSLKGNGKDCLQAVLRLINYAFVDTANQNPILRLSRIRNYNQVNKETEINSTPITEQNKQIDSVINFLESQIKNFSSFKECDVKEKKFLLTVLDLLKSTLMSGYWRRYQDLLQLLTPLLSILKNDKEILGEDNDRPAKITDDYKVKRSKHFKEQAVKVIPSMNLIIQCKQLVCELIQVILDFRTDIRVTHCTIIFKELMNDSSREFTDSDKVVIDGESDRQSIFSFEEEQVKPRGVDGLYKAETWRSKLKEVMKQHDQLTQIVKSMNLNMIMSELSIYKNPELIAKSLRIQYRLLERLTEIMTAFTGIGLVVGGQTEILIRQIQSKRNIFAVLQDENLLHNQVKTDTDNRVIEVLSWFAHSVKKDFNIQEFLQNPGKFKTIQGAGFSIFKVFCERDSLHTLHQKLIRCSDIHPAVLKFLTLCREDLDHYTELPKNILKAVYCFLTMLAKQSLQMKEEIVQWMPIIKQHLKWDIGALELLYEMYSNNKTHLYNQIEIQQIASLMSELIESHQEITIYKCKLMHFFRCLIYFNEDVIFSNQSVILSKLQDSKKKCIYYKDDRNQHCLNIANIQKEIGNFEKKYVDHFADFGKKVPFNGFVKENDLEMDLSPQLTYFICIFDLFNSLVQGPNEVNIGKCKQVHSYNMLLQILRLSKICYPLKKNVRAYINRLYYVGSDYENISEHVIKTQIPLFISDLDMIIMLRIGEPNLSNIYFKDPIRFKYLESDFFLYFQQILVTLHQILYNNDFKTSIEQVLMKNYQKGFYYLHYYIIRIYERLRFLKNQYSGYRFTNNFINSLTGKIKAEFLDKFAAVNANIFDKNQGGRTHNAPGLDSTSLIKKDFIVESVVESKSLKEKRMKELQSRSKKLIKLLRTGQIYEDYLNNKTSLNKNFPLTFSLPEVDQVQEQIITSGQNKEVLVKKLLKLIYGQRQQEDEDVNQFVNNKIARMKNIMLKPQFQQFLSQEFKLGCRDLFQLDANNRHHYNLQFLSLKDYIVTIVKINTERPKFLSNDLKQFVFRILRRFIEEKNSNHLNDRVMVDEWDSSYWEKSESRIIEAQKFLNDAEIPELIIESLKHQEDMELNNEILLFAIAFILGGNSECQKSILKKLTEDKKNEVFINMHQLITNICRTLYSQHDYRKVANNKDRESFNVRLIDDKNFFDTDLRVTHRHKTVQPPNTNQIKRKALSIKVFKRVFRFLQLLCQNNNIDNKNYLREQWDVDKKPKINSINMIEVATFQIRGLFKIMNRDIVKIPLNVLDFINQINQIPCSGNQKTLCRTTFFEDFCYMANFLSDESNQKERHFLKVQEGVSVPSLDSIFQIYNKCINIVTCVLEGNDEEIYKELSTKLQLKFLDDIISRNFKKLNIRTKEDIHKIATSTSNEVLPAEFLNAINVMIILRKIREWDPNCKLSRCYKNLLQDKDKKQLHETLEEYMLSIEIKTQQTHQSPDARSINSQKLTQTVYFPKHPILTYLSGETRDKIMMDVGRQTQREKLVDLFSNKQEIFQQIQSTFSLSKGQKILGFSYGPQQTQFLLNAGLLVSMLISLIWMFTTDVIIEYQTIYYSSPYRGLILLLSLVQTGLTFLYIGGYVRSKKMLAKSRDEIEEQTSARDKAGETSWIVSALSIIVSPVLSILGKIPYFGTLFYYIRVLFNYDREQFMLVVIFATISVLGTFYQTKYFTLHLIFIFTRIELLQNVFKAIAKNFRQLFYVSLLGIVFVYAFCIVTYRIYGPDLHAEEDQQQCDNVIGCLIDMYISGTINGGMEKFAPIRFGYDLVYFMFFGLLFENIISSIVIDTFAELRSERNEMNMDKENKCYICGIERATLQKSNLKFKDHMNKHFLWNYIFYLYCIKKKDSNDYSGLEYQISNKSKDSKNISWIPIYYEDEVDFEKQIQQVRQGVRRVQEAAQKKSGESFGPENAVASYNSE